MFFFILLKSLASSISFGLVDSIMFFLLETSIQKKLNKLSFMNETMAELSTNGFSAAIALFCASSINFIMHKYNIIVIENPFIDALGIIIATIIVISFYYVKNRKNITIKKMKEQEQIKL